MNAEEACKLIDNGWRVLLFKDGMGSYTAIAHKTGTSADEALNKWINDEDDDDVFGEVNRYVSCGFTIAEALHALTEKVLFKRLPSKSP